MTSTSMTRASSVSTTTSARPCSLLSAYESLWNCMLNYFDEGIGVHDFKKLLMSISRNYLDNACLANPCVPACAGPCDLLETLTCAYAILRGPRSDTPGDGLNNNRTNLTTTEATQSKRGSLRLRRQTYYSTLYHDAWTTMSGATCATCTPPTNL